MKICVTLTVLLIGKCNQWHRIILRKKICINKNVKKNTLLTGYTFEPIHKTLKCMPAHGTKSDWRRNRVVRVTCKKCFIIWSCKDSEGDEILLFTVKATFLSGMTCLVTKSQTASGCHWHSVPISVKEHLSLEKSTDYNHKTFNIAV